MRIHLQTRPKLPPILIWTGRQDPRIFPSGHFKRAVEALLGDNVTRAITKVQVDPGTTLKRGDMVYCRNSSFVEPLKPVIGASKPSKTRPK